MKEIEILQAMEKMLDKKLQPIGSRLDSIEDRLDSLDERTQYMKILLENTLPKQIQLIAEQHGDIITKLDAIADYPETKGRVSTLETVVTAHSKDISELQEKAAI